MAAASAFCTSLGMPNIIGVPKMPPAPPLLAESAAYLAVTGTLAVLTSSPRSPVGSGSLHIASAAADRY